MKHTITAFVALAGATLLAGGSANAAEILVNQDIATSTTWTADNT